MASSAHKHLAAAIFLSIAVLSAWMVGSFVQASSQIQVTVGPPDACLNIPGYQMSVPLGMSTDGSGNCFTPPPPVVDVCDNIAGAQATIPSGYFRDSNGNCFIQPAPPVDVCPNLPGIQTLVPLTYTNDENGDCVLIPIDVCENIPGIQTVVPVGMERDEAGVCSTPIVITPTKPTDTTPDPYVAPTEARPTPGGESTPRYINVPTFLNDAVKPLVMAVPESVRTALRTLPPVVAQTFPYYIFSVLGMGAAVLSWQSVREVAAARRLFLVLKRERELAEEKDNFVALASHYLRTPLTVMTTGLDTLVAIKEVTPEQVLPLKTPILALDEKIKLILGDIDSNAALQGIAAPPEASNPPSFLRSGFFWIPIIGAFVLTGLANFFLAIVGNVSIGTANLWMQILIFFAVVFFFYSSVRSHYLRKHDRAHHEQLLEHERTIDAARNEFIERSTAALSEGLTAINAGRGAIASSPSAHFFNDGYERFAAILQKFALLSQIRSGSEITSESFSLREAVDAAIAKARPLLEQQQLTIVNNARDTTITQRRVLFEFVLGSLIDNAVKFSHTGGTIQINTNSLEHKLSLKVSDYGVGIPAEKLPQLFKPFSRADSALEFNYEGLGFSLFLDKIIMDYIGGSIEASSEPEKGSTFTVTARNDKAVVRPATA